MCCGCSPIPTEFVKYIFKVALDKKDKTLERKARNKVHKFKVKVGERS